MLAFEYPPTPSWTPQHPFKNSFLHLLDLNSINDTDYQNIHEITDVQTLQKMLSHLYMAYVHVREIVAIKENEVLASEWYSEQNANENETVKYLSGTSKGLGKSIPIKDVRKTIRLVGCS